METLSLTEKQLASFWAKVDKTETCWNWTGGTARGYGQITIAPRTVYGHRLSYQMVHGVIPSSQILDHTCHNTLCVNPDHLRPVTHKQNMENRSGAQRNNKSTGVRGVSWSAANQKWRADITHNKKQHNLGYFNSIAEAEAVVVAKRNELYTHNNIDRTVAA